jgi:APA family basic amino acid/polyamine antiporter
MATTQGESVDVNGPTPDLKRVMGPKLLLLFVVGDILGAGVYAVTGQMAGVVGGIVWLPFLVAFVVATLTALSYLELVTKYPQAAGAALYTHKAFGLHFVTFLVAFAVICSGITSASTSANVLAQNLTGGLEANGWIDSTPGTGTIMLIALGFMVLLALINLRGVGESVKFNVLLTLVEVTALTIVIGVGFYVIAQGDGSFDRVTTFENPDDKGIFLAVTAATSIAFFAMVGFEDSVNMVEETKEPERIFPRVMLTGLGIAVIIYMLVAVSVVAVLSTDQIGAAPEGGALLEVVTVGAPDFPIDKVFPFLAVFAVANTALINMLMASRLLYGLANQDVLPRTLGKVSPNRRAPYVGIAFSTAMALALIVYVTSRGESEVVVNLSSVTSLLLLGVFTIVNVACLILRRDTSVESRFRSPGYTPAVAALLCAFLVGPWADRDTLIYQIAGVLMLIGIGLWALTWATNRGVRSKKTGFRDVDHLDG